MQNTKPIITQKTITQTAKETCGIVALAMAEQKNAAVPVNDRKTVLKKA
jgi:hypothetical protein